MVDTDGVDTATLDELLAGVVGSSAPVRALAQSMLDGKTKPRGSLGFLEEVAAQYAAVRGEVTPAAPRFAVVVAAADHGVSARGVSAYPAEVTGQMIANIAGGGAAVSAATGTGPTRTSARKTASTVARSA